MERTEAKYDAVVIGASAGGLYALAFLLERLPSAFSIPIVVVLHRGHEERQLLEEMLQLRCKLKVKQADEKETLRPGVVYVAPPNYHLLIESDLSLSLSAEAHIRYSRPSINVLFESAALALKDRVIAILLTGANDDGAEGITAIALNGGVTVVQNPTDATYKAMPTAAIATGNAQRVLFLTEIANYLLTLNKL